MDYKENFTAILPVTCNANCSFCPEKEMEQKASKDEWITNLMSALQISRYIHNHVSLSGGEPTLDPRLLARTIKTISRFPRMGVGITTNGQFLESLTKTQAFMEACRVDGKDEFFPYFINISRHAFDTADNNRLMGTNYRHTMGDIFAFRRMLPRSVSFRLNMVLVAGEDHLKLFNEAKELEHHFLDNNIVISFRTDYNLVVPKEEGLIPKEIYEQFVSVFGECEETYSCPTCVTHSPKAYSSFILKAGDFEPTTKEEIQREFVFHQDGKLYHDWKRNKPVDLPALIKGCQEKIIEHVRAYGVWGLEGGGWTFNWFDEEGPKRLAAALDEYNAREEKERRERERYRGPSCGGHGCGGGCGSLGPDEDDYVDEVGSGCGGSAPTPPPSCGGGRSGGCGDTPRPDSRSQSNCGGVNAFPATDPGPEWSGCSGPRGPSC